MTKIKSSQQKLVSNLALSLAFVDVGIMTLPKTGNHSSPCILLASMSLPFLVLVSHQSTHQVSSLGVRRLAGMLSATVSDDNGSIDPGHTKAMRPGRNSGDQTG